MRTCSSEKRVSTSQAAGLLFWARWFILSWSKLGVGWVAPEDLIQLLPVQICRARGLLPADWFSFSPSKFAIAVLPVLVRGGLLAARNFGLAAARPNVAKPLAANGAHIPYMPFAPIPTVLNKS